MIKRILCLILLVVSVGCSPVSSSWTCKTNLKGTCNSIWEIDNDDQKDETKKNINLKKNFKQKVYKTNNTTNFNDFRSKERVARVVFSPYVDEAGNRHDISVVYYLEQKSDWRE